MTDSSNGGRIIGRVTRGYLLTLVTITGAAVLALEVLGTRVIGTCYGSSLYVWAALLTVTLVCLAVGYEIGGKLADRVPRAWMLYLLVLAAGGSVLAVPRLTRVLEPLAEHFGLTWGAIASALVIFAAPLTLLAMAGPYVIRLRTCRVEGVGSTSGAVYSLSTIGSVAGVLAVSLWMIPTLGTRTSLLVCSALLIGWAAIGLLLSAGGGAWRFLGASRCWPRRRRSCWDWPASRPSLASCFTPRAPSATCGSSSGPTPTAGRTAC